MYLEQSSPCRNLYQKKYHQTLTCAMDETTLLKLKEYADLLPQNLRNKSLYKIPFLNAQKHFQKILIVQTSIPRDGCIMYWCTPWKYSSLYKVGLFCHVVPVTVQDEHGGR